MRQVGAALADSLAAIRVALSILDTADPAPSREVIALARTASRRADRFRELLAALARAHCRPVPRGAADACTVLRRALGPAGRGDREAPPRVTCPDDGSVPVRVPADLLEGLFRDWWRGTRAVLRSPGPVRLERVPGAVEVRARGSLAVSREHLRVACGVPRTGRPATAPVPPGAWYLAAAGVLARRAGGTLRATGTGPVLRLPPWPRP